jgi:DNA-binding MarR family transcriptional regulator
MLAIKGFPGRDRITIGELAGRLQVKHHSAVGLADRLVAEKYARRLVHPEGHRQVYLMLSTRGEAVLKKLSAAHQEELRRLGTRINLLLESLRNKNLRYERVLE